MIFYTVIGTFISLILSTNIGYFFVFTNSLSLLIDSIIAKSHSETISLISSISTIC